MSERRDHQLKTILRVQTSRELATGKKLEQAINSRDLIKRKGDELRGYLDEYESEISEAAATELANSRQFLGSMNAATYALAQRSLDEQKKVSCLREEWVGHRREKLAVEKLIQKRFLQEQRNDQKRADQEVSDRRRQRPFNSA